MEIGQVGFKYPERVSAISNVHIHRGHVADASVAGPTLQGRQEKHGYCQAAQQDEAGVVS